MSKQALLIIDMINTLEFPEGKKLLRHALPVANTIGKIKARMKRRSVPVIYVNDHFGNWRASWEEVYDYCTQDHFTGAKLSQLLKPEEDDYFVLKPKHSGFYSTNLDVLLNDLKVKELILTGIAGNICVLFTANDAYMRGFKIHVPSNAIASNSLKDNRYAIRQLSEVFNVRTAQIK
jgi:nicotinamidase-related amidase